MPINDSGQVSLGGSTIGESISIQVKQTTTTETSMNDTNVRSLANKSSGAISFSDVYGRAYNSLWAWGLNTRGMFGQNDELDRSSAVQIGSSTQIFSSSQGGGPGSEFLLAVINGGLYACGTNSTVSFKGVTTSIGQLGTNDNINRSQLTQVGALTNWKNIGNGSVAGYSLAVKTDGTLWSWGNAGSVQTFQNNSNSSPVQLGSSTFYKQVLNGRSCFIQKTNNEVESFGVNFNGETGILNGTLSYVTFPNRGTLASTWRSMSGQGSSSYGIRTDGTIWYWGALQNQADNNPQFSSPVQLGALSNWLHVSTSTSGCALFLKTDGTLWSLGANSAGILGTNDIIFRSSPVQIGSLTTWRWVDVDGQNCYGIRSDGTLWSWGNASLGTGINWGDDTASRRSSPVQVGGATNWSYTGELRNNGNNARIMQRKQ
jgi:alpha-tubulin suppressor-like RCC1 family protein